MISLLNLFKKPIVLILLILVIIGAFVAYAQYVDRTVYTTEKLVIVPGKVTSDTWLGLESVLVQDISEYSLYQDFNQKNSAYISELGLFSSQESENAPTADSPNEVSTATTTEAGDADDVQDVEVIIDATEDSGNENSPVENPMPETNDVPSEAEPETTPEPTPTESTPVDSEPVSANHKNDSSVWGVFIKNSQAFPLAQGIVTEENFETPTQSENADSVGEELVVENEEGSEPSLDTADETDDDASQELNEPMVPAVDNESTSTDADNTQLDSEALTDSEASIDFESVPVVEDDTTNDFVLSPCLLENNCSTHSMLFSDFSMPDFESGTVLDSVQLRISMAAQTKNNSSNGPQRFLIEYTYDTSTTSPVWITGSVLDIDNEISNSINGGYFLFPLNTPKNAAELANLLVRVSYQGDVADLKEAYVEGMWLDVTSGQFFEEGETDPYSDILTYERDLLTPDLNTLNTPDIDPSLGTLPSFTLSYDPQQNFVKRLFNFLFSDNTFSVDQITLTDNEGAVLPVPFGITYHEDNTWTMKALQMPQKLKPGKYLITATMIENDVEYTDQFEFYWGVLAVNTTKSMYYPNEEIELNLAALTDKGNTICDADLHLKIIDPKNNIYEVPVNQSGSCGANNVTDIPDYLAEFSETGEWGVYTIQLENRNQDGEVVHKISDTFEVRDYIPFDIVRTAPTRIYPPAPYDVTLDITANRQFSGDIRERVPRGFVFESTGGAEVISEPNYTELIWRDVAMEEGDKLTLSYRFDAPDISPYMYLLGPLNMDGFEELRQWQIASDALGAVAWLHATGTTLGTNLNQVTAAALQWGTSTIDNYYFEHSTTTDNEKLTVRKTGDYLVAVTLPLERTDAVNNQWTRVGFEVRVNGVIVPQGIGRSGLIYNISSTNRQNESSSHGNFLLTDLAPGDQIEIFAQGLTNYFTQPIYLTGQASMYVEYIPAAAGVFAAVATSTIASDNLNQSTSSLLWNETRQDSGFVHSNSVNGQNITISDPGAYMVFVNVPVESRATAYKNVLGRVMLDGSMVNGGVFSQGTHIVTANTDYYSSMHWSGVVISTSTNQVLTITTEQEASAGTTTVPTGLQGSIYIQKLPTNDIIAVQGRDLSGGTNWNPAAPQTVLWDTHLAYDSGVFTHSTTSSSSEITVTTGGDYVLVYNDALVIAGGTNNVIIDVLVDGVNVSGAQTKTHYTSNGNGQQDSSGSLVFNLAGLAPGAKVSVQASRDANTTVANDRTDATLMLWKKAEFNQRATIDTASSTVVFDNIRIASTTPFFVFKGLDPDATSDIHYEFSISTTSSFTNSITRNSADDTGFDNLTTPTSTAPFPEGNSIRYQIQSGDLLSNNTTYFWRVRAKDVSGSNKYGDWSVTKSLTVSLSDKVASWYQTIGDQFGTNNLVSAITDTDSVAVDSNPPSDVMMMYGEGVIQTPRYRLWNGSSWNSELSALSVGGTINALTSAAAPGRDEYVMATINSLSQAHVQVYSASTSSWSNLQFLATTTSSGYRGVAVAYENSSSDAMAVACEGSNAVYSIWNGLSWSATTSLPLAKTNDCRWLEMASNPASDEIMLVVKHNRTGNPDYEALVWDGDAWGNSLTFGTGGVDALGTIFAQYNRTGSQAVVAIDGSGTQVQYVVWNGSTWTAPALESIGTRIYNGKLVASPYSDDIAFCLLGANSSIQAMFWTGASWNGKTTLSAIASQANSKPVDCAYETLPGRTGNFLVTYGDTSLARYKFYNGVSWSTEQTISGSDRISAMQMASALDGTLVLGMMRRTVSPRTLYASAFNGTSWSSKDAIEDVPAHNSDSPRLTFDLTAKRYQFSEAVVTTFPVAFSQVPGRNTWGDVVFSTTESLGTDVKIRLKYNNAGVCNSYIPGGALAGNDTGFDVTTQPIDISGLSTTTYSTICLEAKLNSAGSQSAKLNDWQITWQRQPRLIQNNYRWYVNSSTLTPSDPWPLGALNLNQNTALSADEAIDINQSIRLRMSLKGSNVDLPAFEEAFKLQYAAGVVCSPDLAWSDVGEVGSTTALWRGAENSVVGDDWYSGSWTRRIAVTVNKTLVATTTADFPVYVNLANLPIGFFNSVKADGGDIRVTNSDGITERPIELVSINTGTKEGELYFKGDVSSTTDAKFYIYYSNASASGYADTDTYGRNNVWTNGYVGVWHMNNVGTTIVDSTGNGYTGTKGAAAAAPTQVSAPRGVAQACDGNDYITFGDVLDVGTNNWTVSTWYKTTAAGGANANILYNKENLYETAAGGGYATYAWQPHWSWDGGTTHTVTTGTWYQTHIVYDKVNQRMYKNGTSVYSRAQTGNIGSNTEALQFCARGNLGHSSFFIGHIDEMAMSATARTAGWIATEFNNQNNPLGFYTVSGEELISDGRDLPSTLLTDSDQAETYEEQNPTRENQHILSIGNDSEWDFVLQNNLGAPNTNYCFRAVYQNGTLLSQYNYYPKVITNAPPLAPILSAPFDNERLASTSPWFDFAADDERENDVSYEVQVSSDISFAAPEISRESNANFALFTNLANISERGIYTSGQTIRFIPNVALSNGTTYFWRVRAKDDNGSGEYGLWSSAKSFTVTSGTVVSTWYQDLAEQFDTNELENAVANYSGDDIRIATLGTSATTTSTEIDFNKGTIGNAWGNLSFTSSGAGTIRYYVEYKVSGSEYALIPDAALSGNSAGYTSSPVSLSLLDTVLYRILRVRAVHTGTDVNPRLQNWQVTWARTIDKPTLSKPFDNAKISDNTPTLNFVTADPENDALEYEVQFSTSSAFTSPTEFTSGVHSGFQNVGTPADTTPFNSGQDISYTVQSALSNNVTYFWRTRARDPGGANVWSKYSDARSFTINTSQIVPAWHQTVGDQFLSNVTSDIEGTFTSAQITSVISGVMAVYGQGTEITPRYSLWNGNSWSEAQSLEIIGAPTRWVVTKAATLRSEYAAGVQATNQNITVQIYNDNTDTWGNLTTLTTSLPSNDVRRRGFDIAYESDSSRLVAVACDGDDALYSIWNGTSWSATSSIALSTPGTCQWVTMAADPTSNEMVAVFQKLTTGTPDFEALVWNGSSWGNSTTFTESATNAYDSINLSYSSDGSQAMVVTQNSSASSFRYSFWNGSTWSTQLTVALPSYLTWSNVIADPNSDNIALCYSLANAVDGVSVWDGAAWSTPTTLTTTANSAAGKDIDCTYETTSGREGNLMVTYSDQTNGRYQISTSSPTDFGGEQTLDVIEDSWTVNTVRGADGTIHTVFFDDINDNYDYSRWDGTAWTARDQFSTNPAVTGTPFDGSLDMAAQIHPSFNSGSIRSNTINFQDGGSPSWQNFKWVDTTPGGSSITYQVFYESTPGVFSLVSDTDLPGNSTGFTSSPVDISGLDPLVYTKIQLDAEFSCDGGNCPNLEEWTVEWSEGISISGLAFAYDQTTPLTSGTIAVAVNGVLQVGKTADITAATGTQKAVFNSAGTSTFAVPAGITEMTVKAWGAGGGGGGGGIRNAGGSGGAGGFVQGTFSTTPAENLTVHVGGGGGAGQYGIPAGGAAGGGYSGLYRTSTALAIAGAGGGGGGGAGGIGYIGVGEACLENLGTCSPKIPNNTEIDDILIAVVHTYTSTLDHTCSATSTCTGWTEFSTQGAGTGKLSVWWKRQDSENAPLPPVFSGSTNAMTGRIWAFRGVAKTGNPFDQTTAVTEQVSSVTHLGTNITSTVPNTMMVFVGGSRDDNTWGPGSGSCTLPTTANADFYAANSLSNNNSVFLCFDGTPQNGVGSLGIPIMTQATNGPDAGRNFAFNLRPETASGVMPAGIGGAGGGLAGVDGGASDNGVGFTATGGTTTDLNGYRFHTFTSSGTFQTYSSSRYIEVLLMGGGGGGGGYRYGAGGGGAGGFRFVSNSLAINSYSVTVGAGGNGGDNTSATSTGNGQNGSDTSFGGTVAVGGGGGQRGDRLNDGSTGLNGGSGGGGGSTNVNGVTHVGGLGTTTQGSNGGSGGSSNSATNQTAGGGAGVITVGVNGTTGSGGAGGAGLNLSALFGTGVGDNGYFGGGGGGGKRNTGTAGAGGVGGGAAGNVGDNNGITATANTGGGGGGAGGNTTNQYGGAGGSGVVIARYRLPILGGAGGTQIAGGLGSFSAGNGASYSGGSATSGVDGGAGGSGGVLGGGAGGTGFASTSQAGGSGGGAGYFGGGGGARGVDGVFSGAGAGGGSSYVNPSLSATSTVAGSGSVAANTGDSDYGAGAGNGGSGGALSTNGTAGNAGRVVLSWTGSTTPGVWNISNVNASIGDVITVFIVGADGTKEAVAVTKYDGTGDISGVQLSERTLTLGSDDYPTISNANLEVYKNSDNEDVFFDVAGSNVLNLCNEVTCSDARLQILASTTYQPGANGSVINFKNHGVFAPATSTFKVAGNWQQFNSFIPDTSTIIFNATSGSPIIDNASTSLLFHHVTFGETSGSATWSPTKPLSIGGNLVINYGTLARSSYDIGVGGNLFLGLNGYMTGLATTTFKGTGTNTWGDAKAIASSTNIGYVVIDGTIKTITLSGNVAAETLTIGADDTLNASGSGFNINVYRGWTNNNSFIPQSGTVTFVGTTTGVINRGTSAFNNLTFTGVGSMWSFSTSTLALNGNFTIATGTITLPTGTTTIAGSFLNTGGNFLHNNGEVRMTSNTSGKSITQNGSTFLNAFYDLVFSGAGAWAFTESAATTSNTFRIQSGAVTLPSSNLTVGGDYSVTGSGSFLHNSGTVTLLTQAYNIVRTNGSSFNNLIVHGGGGTWYNTAWENRQTLIVDGSKVPSAMTDFPVYVNLDDMPDSFFAGVKSDGSDIRVTTADGMTERPVEVVAIDKIAKTGEIYFKGDISSGANTTFYIYSNNPTATAYSVSDTYGRNNVWSNGFVGVWHMNNVGSTVIDSTGGGNTGTKGASGAAPTQVAAPIGYSQSFDGGDHIDLGNVLNPGANSWTVSTWYKPTAVGTSQAGILYNKENQYEGSAGGNNHQYAMMPSWAWYDGTGATFPTTVGNWYNAVDLYDKSTQRMYRNGVSVYSRAHSGNIGTTTSRLQFGARGDTGHTSQFTGEIDEIRMSAVARSADWIMTEYNNQSSSTSFYSPGVVEQRNVRAFTDTNATILGNYFADNNSETKFPSGILSIGGSFDNNAVFNSNSGTVRFNSAAGSETIAVGSSTFATVDFNHSGGNFTITENATATVAFNLTNVSQFTLNSGLTFAALGNFTNAATGTNTTWTGSTLRLLGADSTINSKTHAGDVYGALETGGDTDIKMWNSSANSYINASTSSIYSQDHAGVDGDLYIFGDYVKLTGTEYWNYVNDFDGAVLATSSYRQANVRVASSSKIGFVNASLNILGLATASTTINAQAGAFTLNATNTTISAEHFTVAGTDSDGFGLKASTTLSVFRDGYFNVAPNYSGITFDNTTVATNPSKQLLRIGFATSSVGTSYNVNMLGTTTSYVWFKEGTGNLYGENYDKNDANPGSIRFDDSSNNISISGTVYSDVGTAFLGAPTCDGVTKNVKVVVNGGAFSTTTTCSAANGTYTFPSVLYVGDPKIVVYLDTNGGVNGSVITKTPSSNITGLNIYANRVIVRHEDLTALNIFDMTTFDFDDDTDLKFVAATGTLTVLPNTELYVFAGKSFTPGGNITLSGNANSNSYEGTLALGATSTFNATGTETHTLAGRLVMATTSVLNTASSTFIFNATTTGKSITAPTTVTFNDVQFTGVGGGWNITAPLNVNGNMTIATGTVTGTSDINIVNGSLAGNGLLSLGAGTTTIGKTNSFGGSSAWTVNNLKLGNGVISGTTTMATVATTTILGRLTISAAHYLEALSSKFDLAGTGTVFVETGTLLEGTSTFRYSGAGANVLSTTYYDLDINAGSGSRTYTGTGLGISVLNNLTVGGTATTNFDVNTSDPALLVGGNVYIKNNGTLSASNIATTTIGGNYENKGTFSGNGGLVNLNGNGSHTIDAGNSSFSNLAINGTGSFTVTENATTTASLTLVNHANFTLASGKTLALGGNFHSGLGGAATTWTGSTLYFYGANTKVINASTTADTYETIAVAANTNVRMWNSSAASYAAIGGIYSQNHAGVTGDLNIYGAFTSSGFNDYWSYAKDFDGTTLASSSRVVNVKFASGASAVFSSGSLEVIGVDTASTSVSNQGSGIYSLTIGGTTNVNWRYATLRNLGANGLVFTGAPTVTDFSFTDHLIQVNSGTGFTVGGTVINANEAKNFTNNKFEFDTGVTGATNITATGTAVSSWRFTNHTGSVAGEANDVDPTGDPGYLVWDDSAALITVSGNVYSDEGSTVSTVCDGSTNNIFLRVAGLTTYSTSCNAGTGAYSLSGVAFGPADTLTLYISGETQKAANISTEPISSISNMHLYENRVIVRHESTNPLTIAKMSVWDSSDDADIPFTAVDAGVDTLSLPTNSKLLIWSGKTFAPAGNVTVSGGGAGAAYDGTLEAQTNATFRAVGTEEHTIGGSFIFGTGATFTAGQSTTTFTTTGAARTIDVNESPFYNVNFTGVGSWTMADNTFTTLKSLTKTNGALTFGSGTTTIGASFNATGGTFAMPSSELLFISTSTGNIARFNGSTIPNVRFAGVGGSWSMSDTNATTTGSFTVATGTVTLPSGIFSVGQDFVNEGNITHNTADVYLRSSVPTIVKANGSTLFALVFAGSGPYTMSDVNLTLADSLVVASGTVNLATGTLAIAGNLDMTGGTVSATTSTILLNAVATGKTVNFGNNQPYNLAFGSATGGWTWAGNATTTNNLSITGASSFTKTAGTNLAVGGVFTNFVGGAATTWTDTVLSLNNPSQYTINTKTTGGDVYGTLNIGTGANIRSWNTSAATTTVATTASLYSQDHNAVDGNLNIYGNFAISTTTEYWSFATDFDGVALSGTTSRAVAVKFDVNATSTLVSGGLQIIGGLGATTTISNQATGTYTFAVTGGTFNAQYYSFANLGLYGLELSGEPVITNLSNGYYNLATNAGILISLSSTTLNANASKIFTNVGFNATGPLTGYNVALTGVTANAWRFTGSYGNIGNESFDIDGIDACGSIRFDNSGCLLTEQTNYRWRNDDGGEGATSGEWMDNGWTYRKRVRIVNPDGLTYSSTSVKLEVSYDNAMQADFDDLRFTAADGVTPVPFWVEKYTASTDAVVWVRVPTISASSIATVFMYFGNSTSTSLSSGPATFNVFDDFEDNNITEYAGDTSLFTTDTTPVYGGTYALEASNKTGRTTDGIYRTGVTTAQGQIIRYMQYLNTTAGSGDEACTLFGVQSPGASNLNYGVCLEQYGVDRVAISKNVSDNDVSGTVLASSSATFATGWYEVEVKWETNNRITAYVYTAAGAAVASTTVVDSTYTSGGIGYTFWFQQGSWDSFTARNIAMMRPATYFGAKQVNGGATWSAAQNTPGGGIPGTTKRLRLSIENSGLDITGQQFQLEYAAKSVSPSCEAVPSVNYTNVPNQASCGSSPVCMQTSSNIVNGTDSTDHFAGVSGQFTAGKVVEDPSSITSSINVNQRNYTELEYVVTPTIYASDAYCFRVTNNGTPLDFYGKVAQLSLQFDPVFGAVNLNNGQPITLLSGTTTSIYATGTVTDLNGYADIVAGSSTIYRSGAGAGCAADINNCYTANTSASSSCTLANCAGNTCELRCRADIYFFADPTDALTYEGEDWQAFLEVSDSSGGYDFASALGVELLTLRALSVDSAINYGSLAVNSDTGTFNPQTNVSNLGNTAFDIEIDGTDLTDGNTSFIPADEQKFSTSTFTYSSCVACASVSSTTPTALALGLIKPTSISPPVSAPVYWGIEVPTGVNSAPHQGINVFTPVSP